MKVEDSEYAGRRAIITHIRRDIRMLLAIISCRHCWPHFVAAAFNDASWRRRHYATTACLAIACSDALRRRASHLHDARGMKEGVESTAFMSRKFLAALAITTITVARAMPFGLRLPASSSIFTPQRAAKGAAIFLQPSRHTRGQIYLAQSFPPDKMMISRLTSFAPTCSRGAFLSLQRLDIYYHSVRTAKESNKDIFGWAMLLVALLGAILHIDMHYDDRDDNDDDAGQG